LIEKQIFRLEVSMYHVVSVTVFHAGHDLLEEASGAIFR
jgi:hypothetical protein